ncbi:MAG: hypothetical protein L0Y72_05435, partial [Gemmataceae bacterium]|nr:hypothetical protein [Gemmataceae bacterium]
RLAAAACATADRPWEAQFGKTGKKLQDHSRRVADQVIGGNYKHAVALLVGDCDRAYSILQLETANDGRGDA